ncbi:MAG: putative porin [Bacteroidales bacterium]|nr:putative porin [Bacteroidales bacterium]
MGKAAINIICFCFLLLYAEYSHANDDTTAVVNAWTIENNFLGVKSYKIDTNLYFFQQFNPIFKNAVSNSYLGNFGSPAQANIFIKRWENHDLLFITPYLPYMSGALNTVYYNTRKPFSKLTYTNGGSKKHKEETLEVLVTQNVNRNFNIGLQYNLISSKGQYAYQKITDHSFKLFASYTGKAYSVHSNFNLNRMLASENGGIADDRFVTDTTFSFTEGIPTNFDGSGSPSLKPNAQTSIRNINFVYIQKLDISLLLHNKDSLAPKKPDKKFRPSIVHAFQYERTSKLYTDSEPLSGFYNDVFINPKETYDSIYAHKIFNAFWIDLKGVFSRKNVGGFNAGISNELLKYNFYTPLDTNYLHNPDDQSETGLLYKYYVRENGDTLLSANNSKQITNTFLTSEIYGIIGNDINTRLFGKYYIMGYKAGNLHLGFSFEKSMGDENKKFQVSIHGNIKVEKPNYLLDNYYSNNYIWENNSFRNISNNSLVFYVNYLPFGLDAFFHYSLIKNYIYFDTTANPKQILAPVSVLSGGITKTFKFWRVVSQHKLIWQVSGNEEVLSLPNLVYYNSTYIDKIFNFKVTGGKLHTLLGFDLYYNSPYYANAYSPAIGTFYQQHDKKLGNYPYVDVYLNLKLKRTCFFLKYEHINSGLLPNEYFSVLSYPRNVRNFKFGISWTFYD